MIGRLANHLWWGLHRDDIERIVTDRFDSMMRPALDDAFDAGVDAGVRFILGELLKEPFVTALPELEEWAKDQRAVIEERRV